MEENKGIRVIQRVLEIENFRNIGVGKACKLVLNVGLGEQQDFGGLVLIVGENNRGKSNLLNALEKFSLKDEEAFLEEDTPSFLDCEDLSPKLTLKLKAGNKEIESITLGKQDGTSVLECSNSLDFLRTRVLDYARDWQTKGAIFKDSKNQYEAVINKTFEKDSKNQCEAIVNKSFKARSEEEIFKLLEELDSLNDAKYIESLVVEIIEIYKNVENLLEEWTKDDRIATVSKTVFASNVSNNPNCDMEKEAEKLCNLLDNLYNMPKKILENLKPQDITTYESYKKLLEPYEEFVAFVTKMESDYNKIAKNSWTKAPITPTTFPMPKGLKVEDFRGNFAYKTRKELYSLKLNQNSSQALLPRIITYKSPLFSTEDLSIKVEYLGESRFFKALIRGAMGSLEGIENAYAKSKQDPAYRKAREKSLNQAIYEHITQKFNNLYNKQNDPFSFEVRLEEEKIYFGMYDNKGEAISLDRQSDGFRWFFNLFFGLLCEELPQGSIVLSDEPAYNLSVLARREFRDLLKSYGESNGVTFILTTHDPFLCDVDNLCELRIIKEVKEGRGVEIENYFSCIENTDSDALAQIKKAFCVDSYIFYPPDTKAILVEGITDYQYLVALKKFFQKESGDRNYLKKLVFLPICGLGGGDFEYTFNKIQSTFCNPIVLVDSDNVGRAFKESSKKYGDKMYVVELGDILADLKNGGEIEDCFIGDGESVPSVLKGIKKACFAGALKQSLLRGDVTLSQKTKENFKTILEYLMKLQYP